jgi:light-regulated signal transduction histidine kinase (bacteriophytochrome)
MAPRPDGETAGADQPAAHRDSSESATAKVLQEELIGFSSRAGHDLLGPLNQAASLLALLVKRYRNELDAGADVILDHLVNAAAKMETVTEGVRRYLNLAGRPIEYGAVDLSTALSSALAVLEPVVKSSGATVTADALPIVECGSAQMIATFEILIDNAIKFRRPEEAPRVHVSAVPDGACVRLAVTDNGIGIDPKYWQEVVLPFRRLNGREYPGAGLGLATARLIARLHGGGLEVESTPGAGTTVTVRLPGRAVAG